MTSKSSKYNEKLSSLFHQSFVKIGISCVSLYCVWNVYQRYQRKRQKLPPGPIGLPLIGSLFSAIDLPSYASYLACNYGSISMIYIGNKPFVFLHSIETVQQVFKNKNALDRNFEHSISQSFLKLPEFNCATVTEKYWRRKRRMFNSVMMSKLTTSFLNNIHNVSLKARVFPSIDQCIANQQPWHFSDDLHFVHFHSIWNACFGTFQSFGSEESEITIKYMIDMCIEASVDILLTYLSVPKSFLKKYLSKTEQWPKYLEKWVYKQLNYNECVFDMNDHTWDEHFQQVRNDASSCVASKLIAEHRRNPDVDSTKNSILQSLTVLFAGGIDTSVNTIEYGLVLLAKYPKVQQQIYDELHAIFGDDIWMEDELQIPKVLNKLHFLRAFVQEVMRLSCVLPLGVPHCNKKNVIEVNGKYADGQSYVCKIPIGSMIISDVQTINKRENYWIEKCNGNAMGVCLDLWLDEKGQFRKTFHKDCMLSFGIGRRNCAGKVFALRSSYVLFAKFVLKYVFSLSDFNDGQKQKDLEIKQKFEFVFVMHPKIPLYVQHRQVQT